LFFLKKFEEHFFNHTYKTEHNILDQKEKWDVSLYPPGLFDKEAFGAIV